MPPARPEALERISHRAVDRSLTLLGALQAMDRLGVKLLFVFDEQSFLGLISIGDLQRAIIDNRPMDTPVEELMRTDMIVAREGEDEAEIRRLMLHIRAECMPLLGPEGELADVVFWEDLFAADDLRPPRRLDTPVVIMAGGRGTRLQPLTNVLPKPLLPLGERTILEDIIARFRRHDVPAIFVTVNYKHELIRFYLDRVRPPLEVEYVLEDDYCGTAGSLAQLKGRIDRTFFVTNCDILINEDYGAILDYHRAVGNAVTLVASLKSTRIPYGTVESGEDGELVSLVEKPHHSYLINTGLYVLEPHAIDALEAGEFCHITELIDRVRSAGGRVGVFPISEKSWIDVGEWPEYREALLVFRSGPAS